MIDEKTARQLNSRLHKIAGQLGGLERMIESGRYCVDVLNQVAAVQAALGGVGKVLLRNHIETCVAEALSGRDREERRQKIDELVKIYGRFCKSV
ncbi:MAG: metal-sensitive transcriptional regulator [Planctomycetota bacterium]|jgi:DNA-binding FrmR family transcriptional regulator